MTRKGHFLCLICYTISLMSQITESIEEEIQQHLSILFKLSMWWRIIYGFLRLILGATLLKITGQPLAEFIYTLMSHELTGKTTDILLEKVYRLFETHDITVTFFIAFYFIFWGVVDIVLSLCLLHHIKKAFPVAMGIIMLFILYGMVRLTITHSLILAGVIVVDLVILYLIHDEYRVLKTPTSKSSTPSDLLPHQS